MIGNGLLNNPFRYVPTMKWFTGTPCDFEGTATFFARDSGLTMRGFKALDIDSGAITLGPPRPDDFPEMTRATIQQLESPAWWSELKLNGLVFYTWGQARFAKMVKAASQAGIKVAQVSDMQGIMSPLSDWKSHLMAETSHYWYEPRWKQICRTLAKVPYSHTVRLIQRDLPFARAIVAGDVFLASTPLAAERFRTFTRRLVGEELSCKVHFVPIPVNFHFHFSETDEKRDEVISVGRWDSVQKRTPLLIDTITLALKKNDRCVFRIFGKTTPTITSWRNNLCGEHRSRVHLEGIVDNATLAAAYRAAKVMLVSAAYEGCHNASAEAICSGATVVGCRSPFLGAIEWHASRNSGRIADVPSAEALCNALQQELASWDCGQRAPVAISKSWAADFHPDRVAKRILELCGVSPVETPP